MNSTNFCAEDLWDLNLTWYTDHPDFTPCFQKTVFVYTPFIFLCLAIPFELYSNHTSKLRLIPWNWLNLSKIISCTILCLLSAIELVINCAVKWDGPETNETVLADLVGPPVKIATYLISILLVLRMRKSGRVTSGPQFIFWLLQCLCQGLTTVSLISQQKVGLILTSSIGLVCTISFVLILFNFILQWFPDSQQTYLGLDDQSLNLSPESKSSFVSQLLFLWLDKTIWKGRKNTITTSDLWDLSNEESVHTIGPLWDRLWEKSKAQNANKMKKLGLLPSLLQAFGLTFVKCGFLQLTDVLLSFVNPLLLNLIIGFVQGDDPVWKGYFYVVILLATSQLASIIDNRYWYELRRVGIKMKTALSVAIYKKSLHLSNNSRKEKNSGEIVNLVSVDCEKISFSCLFVNFPWIAPLQIGLSIFFLYRTIGVSVFAGLGVIFIFFLVNLVVSSYIENYQTTQMEKKDRRVKLISEILNGIKVIKLFSWESSFFERINKLRKDEVKDLRAIEFLEGAMYFAWNTGPILMALVSFATYVLIDPVNNILDTKTAFVSLTLFNTMKTPLILLPYGITTLIQGFVSVRRIGAFLNMEELDIHSISHDEDCQHPVSLKDASFKWNFEPLEPTILKKINLFVPKGSLIALVGKVGSGKSSLLSALLGEMVRIEGEANVKGDIAFVPQQAWLRNATLKNNILFMKKYEKEKYEKVIEACALTPDLEILPGGDETEIGEKGINLSGGQKQRVSLARAVYNDADIYLLDDPLSAVDSHVGKHLYEKVIGPNGLLRKKTRILVTHGINFLPYVDQIVVMKDGEISEFGSYNELLSKKGAFAEFLAEQNQSLNTNDSDLDDNEIKSKDQKEAAAAIVRRRRCSSINPMTLPTYNEPSQSNEFQVGRDLIEDEALEVHGVKFEVYFYYWKAVGLAIFSITLVLYAIAQSFNIVGSIWLSIWTDDKAASSDNHLRNKYLGIYVGLSLMQAFTIMLGIILVSISTLRASVKLHKDLLEHILMSTMAFFDTTPIGRIINRFSRDMDEVDLMIPNHIKDLLLDLSGVVGTLVIVCFACPIIIAVVIPLIFVFYFIQKLYLSVSRQLKRMINVTASPINSSVTESFQGVSSIRAYKLVDYFIKENCDFVEANQQCEYPEATSNFWLQSRLAILGNLLITCEALLAVVYRGSIEPGLVGLMLTYIFTLQFDMYWLVSYLAELEKSIVSVERIKEYQQTSTEAAFEIEETKPQPEWPQEGAIEFENYGTRYREGLDLVLKGISFQVKPSEKIGIVGRTGAGKSSLTLALFRMIEGVQGCIRIDGIDISKLGLSALRSALTIIPQDPVLFTGSLRFNLDPFNRYSDQDIWQTLEHSHLKDFVMQLPNGLDHEVSEGGENLSVGQRQLLCLARALLKKTKVLILDEATAAIDLETDDLIQATIRKEFEDCTVLTIAHRLKTILDNNKILVLDSGKVKEFDKPEILLQNKDTLFYSLARDAGVV